MVILFAIDNFTPATNGTIISTRRLIASLRARGHTVRILAYGATGPDSFPLPKRWVPLVSHFAAKQQVTFAKFDATIARAALDGADVLHLLMPFRLSYRLVRLARQLGIPTTAAFHVHPKNISRNAGLRHAPRPLIDFIFWTWRIHLYDRVAAIHCPSQFIADQLKQHHYRARLYPFSNGVSADFHPTSPPPRTDDKFHILMIGRLTPEKRPDLLLRAVAKSQYSDQIHITLAGDGPKKKSLIKLAQQLQLKNPPIIKFHSGPALRKAISRSDLYIHAAEVEIEGMSCLEAIASGLVPLIACAPESATRQFIIDPRCGFRAGSPDDLARQIDYFITHPAEKHQLRQKYLKYASQFDLNHTTIAMEAMLKYAIKPTP